MPQTQGRREKGRAPGLGLSWGPTVEGCKNLFWVTSLAMQLDGLKKAGTLTSTPLKDLNLYFKVFNRTCN